MPMIIGKQERTLAIDGPYIHVRASFLLPFLPPYECFSPTFYVLYARSCAKIMPTANKAAKTVFDNGKTSSYHINSLFSCQSGKTPSSAFRIVVHRGSGDGGHKRYEFEAENPKLASAFFSIRFLRVALTTIRMGLSRA